jgi:hypothetical protein
MAARLAFHVYPSKNKFDAFAKELLHSLIQRGEWEIELSCSASDMTSASAEGCTYQLYRRDDTTVNDTPKS